ncbi:hypothetical protein [Hyphomonas sp.]|uniref:hypothetical protein n=1 Tax=Hyphomonas sp. TaxID=87 RepID=UPI0039191D15
MFATAASFVAMLCHGCVSSETATGASAAAPVSMNMQLAVPGPLGQGPLNAPSAQMAETVGVGAPGAILLAGSPESTVTVALAPDARWAGFNLTGTGAADLPLAQTNLAWGGSPALSAVAAEIATSRYGRPVEVTRDMSVGLSIDAPSDRTGLGFDVSVLPRYAIRSEGDLSTRRLGGEVRFGQGLELGGKTPEGWYFFVGADGEALVWDNSSSMPSLSDIMDVQRSDQVTVGDLQAGFSIQRGPGQLSFSYIRREMKFDDRNRALKDSEDFAGITFTMRR